MDLAKFCGQVTSKVKKQVVGPFADAMETAYRNAPPSDGSGVGADTDEMTQRFEWWRAMPDADGAGGAGAREAGAACIEGAVGGPPPTIIAAELMSHMVDSNGEPTPALLRAIDECFDAISADRTTLTDDEQSAWLLKINGVVGRGSEYRMAVAAREAREGAPLTREDFRSIYVAEMRQGKFWGVEHDLRVLRGKGMREAKAAPFAARFDAIYYTKGSLGLAAVRDALPTEHMEMLRTGEAILPNEWHASDHLPVAAAFRFAEELAAEVS